MDSVPCRPFLSPSPLSLVTSVASVVSPPSLSRDDACAYQSPSPLWLLPTLSASCLVQSGARRWHTAPDIDMNTSASSLATLTSRSLACRRGPAFTAGVNGRKSLLFWCCGVSRQRRLLLLTSVFQFDLDRSDCWFVLAIYIFDYLYC